jgi:hypothetical protein
VYEHVCPDCEFKTQFVVKENVNDVTFFVIALFVFVVLIAAVGIFAALTGHSSKSATFTADDCAIKITHRQGTGCGGPLSAAIAALRGGQTLTLARGTYDVGAMTVASTEGTSKYPITVRGRNHPLIRGYMLVDSVRYLRFDGIDFEARVPDLPAVQFQCGTGWVIQHGHMWTESAANLVVSGNRTGPGACVEGPRAFTVKDMVFAVNTRVADASGTAVLFAFQGNNPTSGVVSHNVFRDAGLTLFGVWHVTVEYNTFYRGPHAIFLQGDVRYTKMLGNLFVEVPVGVGTFGVKSGSNTLAHTYGYRVKDFWSSPVTDLGDNREGVDPSVSSDLVPDNIDAGRYGAYSDISF